MCGIAGIFNSAKDNKVSRPMLKRMVNVLQHRGPDNSGHYINDNIGLGHARLSIIDLKGGDQPIFNENNSIAVVFNGEIFNYIELRKNLIAKGHQFKTNSDTEVIVHLYEDHGVDFLNHLNGQYAIALWDDNEKKLFLARDRVGIHPLFYSILPDGGLAFASEIKSLFQHNSIDAEIDCEGLDQIFTLWVNIPPKTVFKNIFELPPAHCMVITTDKIEIKEYWKLSFPDEKDYENHPLKYYSEKLTGLLDDAVALRLRADVPVASYLSGGIDSSIISVLAKKYQDKNLMTFSVSFKDKNFDEKSYQEEMVNHIGTEHFNVEIDYNSISNIFNKVVWHAEKPMIRTAPAPLFLLSKLVHDTDIRVVLTGEGADEFFGGYNIFKEDKIRRFWARDLESTKRPNLITALYPYITRDKRTASFWKAFFKKGINDINNPFYSHMIRWNNTSHIKKLFSNDYFEQFNNERVFQQLEKYIDQDISRWHPLCRAQYLEAKLFLPGYLLSTQGDRMLMANSVEGRFPFLDHRVIEFASEIPPKYKISGLNEKYLLKKTFKDILPSSIIYRDKQPYRAPIGQCFSKTMKTDASEVMEEDVIKKYNYFIPENAKKITNKINSDQIENMSERDNMSAVAIASLQLLHKNFIDKR